MAISFVGAATGTTSATLPAHAAGDLLLAFAHRDGNTTAPSLPAGWTDLGSSGANVNSSRLGFKVATSSSETSGTWTNATGLVVLVYRGCASADPIGDVIGGGSSSLTVSYPALTMQVSAATSWVVGVAGHRSVDVVGLDGPPAGFTNRAYQQDATATIVGHDTAAGVSSWAGASDTLTGTSGGWRSWSVELLAAAEGGGESASGGSSSLIDVTSAGSGSAAESASGGAISAVDVTSAGAGAAVEHASGGAASVVDVVASGAGVAQEEGAASGGSASIVEVIASGAGQAAEVATGGASSVVAVTAAGAGTKQEEGAQEGGSASIVAVSAAGAGVAREAASGGAASLIRVLAFGAGIADDGTQIVLPPVRCIGSHRLASSVAVALAAPRCAGSHRTAASVTTTVRPIP